MAVLGDMLELGRYEERGHRMVGMRAAEVVDELVTVGELGRIIAHAAHKGGLSAQAISETENSDQAIEFLKGRLDRRDVVLVKGSRGMRMDEIVSALEVRE